MKADAERPIKTIVFVDDDRFLLEAVGDFLRASGYEVHTAADGLEALSIIRKVKPDCIVLDIVLPKIDGGQVCTTIRQDPSLREIPIIAFSGLAPKDFRLFPDLNADAYVAKGPLPATLVNVRRALNHFEGTEQGRADGILLGYESFRERRLDHELLRERRHQAAILRAITPGALELDRDGRIVMANPGACDILKMKEALLVGEPFASLCPHLHRKDVEELLSELRQASQPVHFQTRLPLGGAEVPVRLATIVIDATCNGFLVMIQSEMPRAAEWS